MILFANQTQKLIAPDGYTCVTFPNGDRKETYADSTVVYFYAAVRTTHTTRADGVQLFEFADRQLEIHNPDGTKEIRFPDQTVKFVHANGDEHSIFPDGSVSRSVRPVTAPSRAHA